MIAPDPQRLAVVVRRAVLTEFAPDSCIASTLAVIETARYFGVKARPQATTVRVYSRVAWDQREALAEIAPADWPPGAYSVGIDGGAHKPGRWNGHLIALTATVAIDASLDQFSRPRRGLVAEPSAFPLPAGGWANGDPIGFECTERGTVVIYERHADADWRRSPNWRASLPAMRRVVGLAIRELRE